MHTVTMKYIILFAVLCLTLFTAPPAQASSCFPTGIMVAQCEGTTCKKGFEFYTSDACGVSTTQDAQIENLEILSHNLFKKMGEIPKGLYEMDFVEGVYGCVVRKSVSFLNYGASPFCADIESIRASNYPNVIIAKVIIKLRASTPPIIFVLNMIVGVLIFRVLSEKMGYVYKSILGFSALILIVVAIYLYAALGFEGTWVAVSTILVLLLFKFFKTKHPSPTT